MDAKSGVVQGAGSIAGQGPAFCQAQVGFGTGRGRTAAASIRGEPMGWRSVRPAGQPWGADRPFGT